jgi:hypothetical protein
MLEYLWKRFNKALFAGFPIEKFNGVKGTTAIFTPNYHMPRRIWKIVYIVH